MKKPRSREAVLALGFVVLVSACGGSSADVAFESQLDPLNDVGTFTARGGAVESGVMCVEGDFSVGDSYTSAEPWWFEETYVCTDGTGSFTLRTELDLPEEEVETVTAEGIWTVTGGSGEYTDLAGRGRFSAMLLGFPIEEIYTGDLNRP